MLGLGMLTSGVIVTWLTLLNRLFDKKSRLVLFCIREISKAILQLNESFS